MRYLFYFWALPLIFFWGWYGLSSQDYSMGIFFLTRELHDKVFDTYSAVLGIPAQQIPALAAKACVVDSAFLGALIAIRYRRSWVPNLIDWLRQRAAATR